jgi:anti-sigma28 factor (negative regulator of flagellin synthesis)
VTSNRLELKSLSFECKLRELQRLKEAVADGTYAVPMEEVAASVIKQMLNTSALNKVGHG